MAFLVLFSLDGQAPVEEDGLLRLGASAVAGSFGGAGRHGPESRRFGARSSAAFPGEGPVVFRMLRRLAAGVARAETLNRNLDIDPF